MAAEQDGAVVGAAQRVPVVPCGVPLDLERQVRERLGEGGSRTRPGLRPRHPLGPVLVTRQRAELLKAGDDTCRAARGEPIPSGSPVLGNDDELRTGTLCLPTPGVGDGVERHALQVEPDLTGERMATRRS